jgi:hypothetical protein
VRGKGWRSPAKASGPGLTARDALPRVVAVAAHNGDRLLAAGAVIHADATQAPSWRDGGRADAPRRARGVCAQRVDDAQHRVLRGRVHQVMAGSPVRRRCVAQARGRVTCPRDPCSTVFYLRVREKYIQRQNAEYEKTLPHNRRPAPKKKKEELERTLKSLQAEVRARPSPSPARSHSRLHAGVRG